MEIERKQEKGAKESKKRLGYDTYRFLRITYVILRNLPVSNRIISSKSIISVSLLQSRTKAWGASI